MGESKPLKKYKTRFFTADLVFRQAKDLQFEKTDRIVQTGFFYSFLLKYDLDDVLDSVRKNNIVCYNKTLIVKQE